MTRISTVQSSSFRGYSKNLVTRWLSYFEDRNPDEMIFLEKNAYRCLKDFEAFVPGFESHARMLAEKINGSSGGDSIPISQQWLDEKIGKALDIYWGPLSQAMTQFTSPVYQPYFKELMEKFELLPRMDSYLQKMNELVGRSGAEAITRDDIILYFDDVTIIRRPPYTRMALISTPFRVIDADVSNLDSKLTGIAHELGHYLYWRMGDFFHVGDRQKAMVDQITRALTDEGHNKREIRFVKAWVEELFADFVATKVGGDVFVQSNLEMVLSKNKTFDSLGLNDSEHVPDILRPLISMYTFNKEHKNDQDDQQVRSKTKTQWKEFFQERFCSDLEKIIIWDLPEEHERLIQRSPEDLVPLILDTVDLLFRELELGDAQGLFRSDTATADVAQMESKARKIVDQMNKPSSEFDAHVLDMFLDPIVLEGELSPHPHTVKVTTSGSHHGSSSFNITHT